MNGYHPSTQAVDYVCPKCRDQNGYIVDDFWHICECVEQKRLQKIMKSSQITSEFQKLTFANFSLDKRPSAVKKAFTQANYYVDHFEELRGNRQNSMGFHGDPGSGKTHVLMAVANALLQRGVSVLYFPYAEGADEIHQASRKDDDAYSRRIEAMKHVDLLFIDDLFKGTEPSKFQIKWLFSVINYRYLNHLPILLSSEKSPDDIMNIDLGLGSRLYEMTKTYLTLLKLQKGEDHLILNYRLMP